MPFFSFEGMQWIMRYNDFQHDPLASQIPDCQYAVLLSVVIMTHVCLQIHRVDELHALEHG